MISSRLSSRKSSKSQGIVYLHLAVFYNNAALHLLVKVIHDADIGVSHGIRVIINIHLSDVCLFALQIELIHVVLLGFHHIYGIVMDCGERAVPVHLGDHLVIGRICRVHDHHILRIYRS